MDLLCDAICPLMMLAIVGGNQKYQFCTTVEYSSSPLSAVLVTCHPHNVVWKY